MFYRFLNKWLEEKPLKTLPRSIKLTLIDNTSLTKRLKTIPNNKFRVKKIHQKYSNVIEVKGPLKKFIRKNFFVYRRVELISNKCDLIHAESYLPVKYLTGKERFINLLGQRSLGTYILKTTRFKKLYIKYFPEKEYICRSILYGHKMKVILVNEYFLKTIHMNHCNLLKCRSKFREGIYN